MGVERAEERLSSAHAVIKIFARAIAVSVSEKQASSKMGKSQRTSSNDSDPKLRIAWIGPAGEETGGVPGMGTQLLESVLAQGHEVHLFAQETETAIAKRLSRFDNLSAYSFPAAWEWGRWYSRPHFLAFLTSSWQRAKAYRRAAKDLIKRNGMKPFDCIFQVSQTELFNLGRSRHRLPPIAIYPCVHAAGELRWHRRESRYALQSESNVMHYGARAFLIWRSWLQRRELRKPAIIIGMSRHFVDLVTEDYGVPKEKLRVLYHPMALARGIPGPGSPVDDPVRLIYAARISVRKGFELIVELSHRLDDMRGRVSIEVIGGATLWSNYLGHIAELNPHIASHISHLAHDKMQDKLATADGLLLPSRYEPGGLVVGEALSHGTPIVVSDVIGSAEPIQGECCRRFPDGDIDAFEKEVRRLIEDTKSRRVQLRSLAASEAKTHFSPEKIGVDLIRILNESIADRKASKES